MAGEEVGDIFADGRAYDVQVWTTPEWRHSVTSVQQMLIDTPTGKRVRLNEVADVQIMPTPNVIKREGGSRRIDVQAGVEGRDLGAVAQRRGAASGGDEVPARVPCDRAGSLCRAAVGADRTCSCSLSLPWGRSSCCCSCRSEAGGSQPSSFLTLPSALVGGVLAAFAAGGVITLGSLVGFLSVLGIAAARSRSLRQVPEELQEFDPPRIEIARVDLRE